MTGKIKYIKGNIIFMQSCDKIIPIFAVYNKGQEYFLIVPGYASTVHKVIGQTLQHVTLVFDISMLSPAVGCVALSRVLSIMSYLSYCLENLILLMFIDITDIGV